MSRPLRGFKDVHHRPRVSGLHVERIRVFAHQEVLRFLHSFWLVGSSCQPLQRTTPTHSGRNVHRQFLVRSLCCLRITGKLESSGR